MDISKCKGCNQVIYTPDPKNSWCWESGRDINDLVQCPINYDPPSPKGRKPGWSNAIKEPYSYDERCDQDVPRAED